MKKRLFYLLTAGIIAISSLTGCGSGSYYKNDSMMATESAIYAANDYVAYTNNIDYSRYDEFVTADGRLVDVSYNFSANGDVKEKKTGTNLYDEIKDYVQDNGGYVENVSNTFNYYDSKAETYYNNISKEYEAYGSISFTIQIPNDCAEDVITKLEDYCNDNGLVITTFNQYITNYKAYNIVDEYDEDYYYNYYPEITQSDLDKQLEYTDINVTVNYGIKRDFLTKTGIEIRSFFEDVFDQFEELLYVVLTMIIIGFVIIFMIVVGSRIIRKSIYKRRKKHPEWYQPKELIIHNADNNIAVNEETKAEIKAEINKETKADTKVDTKE